jgi:DNA replication protein DnaC
MNTTIAATTRRPRGGRTVSKATIDEVMDLSRNLPLTRSVLKATLQDATPGQLGLLASLFKAENASREQSRRLRLLKHAGFPQAKELDGYDWSTIGFPQDWGRNDLLTLEFIEHAEDLVLYGDVGTGKTHLAIAIGRQACRSNIPVRFFTAAGLIMRLRKAKAADQLDRELKAIGQARLLVIDELGYLPIDIEGARLLFQIIADSYEKRSIIFTSNLEFSRWGDVFGDGDMAAAVIDRIIHHGRIIRFTGESYRNTHSLMNN